MPRLPVGEQQARAQARVRRRRARSKRQRARPRSGWTGQPLQSLRMPSSATFQVDGPSGHIRGWNSAGGNPRTVPRKQQTLGPASVATTGRYLHGTVNLIGSGRDKAHDAAMHTNAYARAATPVTSAQVWKAWVRAARYWAAGR